MLTKDILFGMNVLTLVGFLVMGLSLTLHRTGNAGVPLSIGLMCAGTALVNRSFVDRLSFDGFRKSFSDLLSGLTLSKRIANSIIFT